MYEEVFFDIIGKCNAKCKYCVNGQNSISGHIHRRLGGSGIEPNEFKEAISYMFHNKLIESETVIHLFNWAEPFLHSRIREILSILNEYDLRFDISTNASLPILLEDQHIRNLEDLTFSMSGFSQASYDKIHGFNFNQIKSNIYNIVNHYRSNGYRKMVRINYHVYQFNWFEMINAKQFADSLDIDFVSYLAYFNGFTMCKNYLSNDMGYNTLKHASNELMTFYYDDLLANRPPDYECPQFGKLVLNEYCEVLVCCCVDRLCRNYSIGRLFDLSPDEIEKQKVSQPICRECREIGLDYLAHNPLRIVCG